MCVCVCVRCGAFYNGTDVLFCFLMRLLLATKLLKFELYGWYVQDVKEDIKGPHT